MASGSAIERLETQRLVLRPFREEDLDDYAEMCGDTLVMKYLGGAPLNRMDSWRNMATVVGHWQLRGFGPWAVEELASGQLVGRVGCWRPEGWPGLELAWTLRRQFWGKGYATEAARAALDVAFSHLAQSHVISMIHIENEASLRVARRLGMRLEGSAELLGHPVVVYGIRRTVVRVPDGAKRPAPGNPSPS
jgi:RimJ/RimL family protein N-acetyltransferase